MNMKYEDILNRALNEEHYFSNEDLRINRKYGFLLSNKELSEFLTYKENSKDENKHELPLKTFNSSKIFYFSSNELVNAYIDYISFFKNDYEAKNSTIISENYNEMILSRISSELDGTLKIEGVNTTRKKILSILEHKNPNDLNEQIIYNMNQGYEFILSKPKFNKENLRKLYLLLSDNSLKPEDEIKEYYRNEMVEIGGHDGCPVNMIEKCMDSLFSYVNENINKGDFYLPFIVHYYILYIHPYIDFNGRTARMVSLWISMLMNSETLLPTYISEAINDDKFNYYKAIDNSRNSHNDLTYFLTYLTKLANQYYLIYKNITAIRDDLAILGEAITNTEVYYLKRIFINSKKGWFNYAGFISFCHLDITKQGALKILNKFLGLNILKFRINSRKEKIFILNDDVIKYSLKY